MEIKNKHVLIILLIIVFHAINNYIWLSLNQRPVFDDNAIHLLAGLKIIKMFETFSWGSIARVMSFSVSAFYPPLFHFCMAVFNLIFGKSLVSSVMTNILFLTILGFSLYYIGKKLGDKKIGVLSFFIISMYPYVFGLSRIPLPDFALTAIVALSLCGLIYTENFTNKPFSLLFGISLGLGMLIKQVFAFFIIAPFIFVIVEIFLKQKMDSSRVKNLIIAFLASIFSGGYWYFLNLKQILPDYMRAAYVDAHMFGPHHFCSVNSLVYYLDQLGRNQMLPFFCFIFVVGAFMFFRSKIKNKLFWLSSIVGAYLIFAVLILTKEPKSTVPYLSFFAIISAAGILNIRNLKLKKGLVVFLVVFGLYQFYIISYTSLSARRDNFPLVGLLIPKRNLTPIISFHHYYSRQDLGLSQVLSVIEEQEKNGKRIVGVSWQNSARTRWRGAAWNDNYVVTNGYTIEYYCKVRGLKSIIVSLNNNRLNKFWWNNKAFLPDTLILVNTLEKLAPGYVAKQYRLYKTITVIGKSKAYAYIKI